MLILFGSSMAARVGQESIRERPFDWLKLPPVLPTEFQMVVADVREMDV